MSINKEKKKLNLQFRQHVYFIFFFLLAKCGIIPVNYNRKQKRVTLGEKKQNYASTNAM